MVEDWAEKGEFEWFVVFTTYDKVGGEELFDALDISSGESLLLLDGLKVGWPVLVDVGED